MKLKIMVSGRNRKIARDICDHLERDRGLRAVKCPVSRDALIEMVLADMPQVIIICLRDENSDTVKAFDVLRDCERIGYTTVIVVANEEDRKCFMANSRLARVFFLSRPIPLSALYAKLDEVRQTHEREHITSLSLFTEYINPDTEKETARKHILVVDDDPLQLWQIKEHLKEFYDVTVVSSGKAALQYLKGLKADMILLDYLMPEMDGPETLMRIREMPEAKDIPVVFLTGVSDKDKILKVIVEQMPQGYLLKPTKKSELVAKIIDVLG